MQSTIQNLKTTRKYLLTNIEALTTEQLNKTPEGFNNNIIWNLAHMIAATQGICYVRSGLPIVVEEKYFNDFKPGTKPERYIDTAEIALIKEMMFTSLDRLEADVQTDIFKTYTSIVTRYGVELKSVEDGIAFLPFHEGMHTGAIMAIAKIV